MRPLPPAARAESPRLMHCPMSRRALAALALLGAASPLLHAKAPAAWHDEAFRRAEEAARRAVGTAFVRELAAGTLPRAAFTTYLSWNAVYLEGYAASILALRARLEADSPLGARFDRWAKETDETRLWTLDLYARWAGRPLDLSEARGSVPDCVRRYMALESASARRAHPAVGMAALLPCFWIYGEMGRYCRAHAKPKGNPYLEWFSASMAPEYAQSVEEAARTADELARGADASVHERMTEVFLEACGLEAEFFEAAVRGARP